MMKKCVLLCIIASLCLLLTGCNGLTAWAGTSTEVDAIGRAGLMVTENTEAYVEASYKAGGDIGEQPDRLGVGVIYHMTQNVAMEDTERPSPFRALTEAINVRPYVGCGAYVPLDGTQREPRPEYIAGAELLLLPQTNLYWEWVTGDFDDDRQTVGIRFQF